MILVTGATGAIGGRVATLLREAGAPLRLMARRPEDLAAFAAAAEVVAGDYADPDSLAAATKGVDTILLISGLAKPMERAKLHGNVTAAAKANGVGRLVYLSFQGASPDSRFPFSRDHYATEQHLKSSGLGFTILRDCFYLDLLADMFNAEGVVRGPAGQGRTAFVAREDVAQVAATVLQDEAYAGCTLELTGPEAMDLGEAARRLSGLTGRALSYDDEAIEAGRAWRSGADVESWRVEVWLGSYLAIGAGEMADVSGDVEAVTGRPPQSLEAYFAAFPEQLGRLAGRPD